MRKLCKLELIYEYINMDEKTVKTISARINEFLEENHPEVKVTNIIGKNA